MAKNLLELSTSIDDSQSDYIVIDGEKYHLIARSEIDQVELIRWQKTGVRMQKIGEAFLETEDGAEEEKLLSRYQSLLGECRKIVKHLLKAPEDVIDSLSPMQLQDIISTLPESDSFLAPNRKREAVTASST